MIDIIYNILQIIGGFSIYIVCFACLYRRAKSQERNTTPLTNVNKVNIDRGPVQPT